MIQRKKSLRDYCREKALRNAATGSGSKTAVLSRKGAQDGAQATRKQRAGLKRQSAKAKALIPARKACQSIVRERSGGRCEAQIHGVCAGRGIDVHEIKARSAGGLITNPENCMNLCRPCHEWINEHANAARDLGFIAPRGA